jgi:hypothetical protein
MTYLLSRMRRDPSFLLVARLEVNRAVEHAIPKPYLA